MNDQKSFSLKAAGLEKDEERALDLTLRGGGGGKKREEGGGGERKESRGVLRFFEWKTRAGLNQEL